MTIGIPANLAIGLLVGLSFVAFGSQAPAQQYRRYGETQQYGRYAETPQTSSREAAIRSCYAIAQARYPYQWGTRGNAKNRHFAYLACMTSAGFTP